MSSKHRLPLIREWQLEGKSSQIAVGFHPGGKSNARTS
jgi:hypothetical protein